MSPLDDNLLRLLPRSDLQIEPGGELSNAGYQLLVQSVIDYAIYMLDPDGFITSWNNGARQIKGYEASEVLGKHFSMFYTEEDRLLGAPAKALLVATEVGRFNGEAWRIRRDGSSFRALVAIDAIRDADGELIGFAKVTRDVTDSWEVRARLEESERRYRLFVEGLPGYALCMLDNEGRIREWNPGAARLTGYEAGDVLASSLVSLFPPDPASRAVVDRMLSAATTVGSYEADHWIPRKDGSRFLAHVQLRSLRDEKGVLHGYACIMQDVSEQRATETELEETRAQLFQSQKLDALGQLTGGVAHDFNNILQALTSGLEIAQIRLERGQAEAAGQQIDEALRSVERAMHLTRRLLAFARRQPLMPSCVDVGQLVVSMTELLERTVGKRISIAIELADSPLYVMCDANQLETALLNLAINGRDAMPDGGTLKISTELDRSDPKGQAYAMLVVEDNGIGMSRDMAARAFDPFFTTKPLGRGTGLGLSMIHGFVKQSQGTVRLRSRLGKGTRVELCLPSCEPTESGVSRL
jgi:PAS domain S-box-containing protein